MEDVEDIEGAGDVEAAAAAAVMAAGEEDTEAEAAADMVAVAAEVMDGPVETPTETADQSQLKKAKKWMLQSTPWADEETE